MAKVITTELQHSGASGANITLDSSKNVTCENNLTVDGTTTLTGAVTLPAGTTSDTLSFRNLIINGAMAVNQRVSTSGLSDFNVVTGNLYTLDRWEGVGTSSFDWDSARIKQVSDSPDEFSNSLRVDIGNTETPGAGQNGLVRTKIEAQNLQHLAYGTSSAKSCTLSFWVRSNKTGTYCVQIQQRDADKHLLYEYSISSANTWEKKTITFSGNTSDAITNDNGIGFQISFHLACHSDDHESATTSWAANSSGAHKATSNQVNLWDHVDNVWYITGVQLELGSTATDFEHRSYGDELARCQRYFVRFPGPTGGALHSGIGAGYNASTSEAVVFVNYPVSMRAAPTATISSNSQLTISTAAVNKESGALSSFASGTNSGCLTFNSVESSIAAGDANILRIFNTGAYASFNSEL